MNPIISDLNFPQYISFGIVLEQIKFSSFNMAIGTIGYISTKNSTRNPFGILTDLGWEPPDLTIFNAVPVITYRGEWIFDTNTVNINSVSCGLGF